MNIYCIGRNYADHAKELGNEVPDSPVVFLKTSSCLRGFERSEIAFTEETFHYEGELILQIGKDHTLGEDFSKDSIESIALGVDLTRRAKQSELKNAGLPWTVSKSFLGSAILGSFNSVSLFEKLENIQFEFYLNNELKQTGNTKNMLFSFESIITYLNSFSPLNKGDLIFTGTPEGVGEIKKGDLFEMKLPDLNIVERGEL